MERKTFAKHGKPPIDRKNRRSPTKTSVNFPPRNSTRKVLQEIAPPKKRNFEEADLPKQFRQVKLQKIDHLHERLEIAPPKKRNFEEADLPRQFRQDKLQKIDRLRGRLEIAPPKKRNFEEYLPRQFRQDKLQKIDSLHGKLEIPNKRNFEETDLARKFSQIKLQEIVHTVEEIVHTLETSKKRTLEETDLVRDLERIAKLQKFDRFHERLPGMSSKRTLEESTIGVDKVQTECSNLKQDQQKDFEKTTERDVNEEEVESTRLVDGGKHGDGHLLNPDLCLMMIDTSDTQWLPPAIGVKMRRPAKRWGEIETNTLQQAVNIHGTGNWSLILNLHKEVFIGRTNVDLKDKWRNILIKRAKNES